MWTCIGFLIFFNHHVETIYLRDFYSAQECMEYGQKWVKKHKKPHAETNFICERRKDVNID